MLDHFRQFWIILDYFGLRLALEFGTARPFFFKHPSGVIGVRHDKRSLWANAIFEIAKGESYQP